MTFSHAPTHVGPQFIVTYERLATTAKTNTTAAAAAVAAFVAIATAVTTASRFL